MTDKTVSKNDEIENLSRRTMLKTGVALGAGAAIAAVANSATAAATNDTCTTVTVDPNYDDGQLLYRRNDGGDANADITQPISEGQTFGDMIIKASAMYQTSGHMSEMETTIGPKTIIPLHKHINAHQIVHVLGVIDPTFDFDEEGAASAGYIVDTDPNQPGGVPSLHFQFDVDTDNPSEIIEVKVGDFVHKPANRSHTFWNASGRRIAYIEISTGVDFEIFTRGSTDIETVEDLVALQEESQTYFSDINYLAALMVEHGLFNVKGMGGLNNLIQKYKDLLITLMLRNASEKGIDLPFDLFNQVTINTY